MYFRPDMRSVLLAWDDEKCEFHIASCGHYLWCKCKPEKEALGKHTGYSPANRTDLISV